MKSTDHIIIECPLEKVFLWMFQPQHIIQLITWDPTIKYDGSNSPDFPRRPKGFDDPEYIERTARYRRFLEQAETKIEIENLSMPTLHVGTTFDYSMNVRSRSEEFPAFSKFPEWKRMYSGSITIQKSVPPTFFAFAARRSLAGRFSRPKYHHLAFQAQQERTIMTYTQLTGTGMIASMIVSALIPRVAALNNEWVRRQLLHLKTQMEVEID
jgi:hypothetical protein